MVRSLALAFGLVQSTSFTFFVIQPLCAMENESTLSADESNGFSKPNHLGLGTEVAWKVDWRKGIDGRLLDSLQPTSRLMYIETPLQELVILVWTCMYRRS